VIERERCGFVRREEVFCVGVGVGADWGQYWGCGCLCVYEFHYRSGWLLVVLRLMAVSCFHGRRVHWSVLHIQDESMEDDFARFAFMYIRVLPQFQFWLFTTCISDRRNHRLVDVLSFYKTYPQDMSYDRSTGTIYLRFQLLPIVSK
jgi:hypothetical protein